MKNSLTSNSIVSVNDFITFTEIDNEIVVFNPKLGDYFGLNPIASKIWKTLDSDIKVETIIQHLLLEFDVEYSTCKADVMEILTKWSDDKLITIYE